MRFPSNVSHSFLTSAALQGVVGALPSRPKPSNNCNKSLCFANLRQKSQHRSRKRFSISANVSHCFWHIRDVIFSNFLSRFPLPLPFGVLGPSPNGLFAIIWGHLLALRPKSHFLTFFLLSAVSVLEKSTSRLRQRFL